MVDHVLSGLPLIAVAALVVLEAVTRVPVAQLVLVRARGLARVLRVGHRLETHWHAALTGVTGDCVDPLTANAGGAPARGGPEPRAHRVLPALGDGRIGGRLAVLG